MKDEQEEIIFDFDDEEIVEMAEEGRSTREIARELGVDQKRVVQIMKEQKEKKVTSEEDRQMADLLSSEPDAHNSKRSHKC